MIFLKVLITGMNGFVGRYLEKYLQTKDEVVVFGTTREKISSNNLLTMDILNKNEVKKVLEKTAPDCIFHFAAQSSVAASWLDPQYTMAVNINGSLNLLDSIKEMNLKSRVLLVGSCEEYGYVSESPINELQNLQPINPYAVSKTSQYMLSKLYVKSFGLDIVIARSFNQIGVGQDPKFVISYFAKRIAEIEFGITDNILRVGNLDAVRDFLDIRDAIEAYWTIMDKGVSGEVYNVGSGKGYRIDHILEKLLLLSKASIQVQVDLDKMRPAEVPISICDNTKINTFLKWSPKFPIESSLKEILDYWRKFIREEVLKN